MVAFEACSGWKLVSNSSSIRFDFAYSSEVKKMVKGSRAILAGTIVLASLLVGVSIPVAIPSFAAANSHSYNVLPMYPQVLSLTKLNGNLSVTVTGVNGQVLHCVGYFTPNFRNGGEVGDVSFHFANGTYIFFAIDSNSCNQTNG